MAGEWAAELAKLLERLHAGADPEGLVGISSASAASILALDVDAAVIELDAALPRKVRERLMANLRQRRRTARQRAADYVEVRLPRDVVDLLADIDALISPDLRNRPDLVASLQAALRAYLDANAPRLRDVQILPSWALRGTLRKRAVQDVCKLPADAKNTDVVDAVKKVARTYAPRNLPTVLVEDAAREAVVIKQRV